MTTAGTFRHQLELTSDIFPIPCWFGCFISGATIRALFTLRTVRTRRVPCSGRGRQPKRLARTLEGTCSASRVDKSRTGSSVRHICHWHFMDLIIIVETFWLGHQRMPFLLSFRARPRPWGLDWPQWHRPRGHHGVRGHQCNCSRVLQVGEPWSAGQPPGRPRLRSDQLHYQGHVGRPGLQQAPAILVHEGRQLKRSDPARLKYKRNCFLSNANGLGNSQVLHISGTPLTTVAVAVACWNDPLLLNDSFLLQRQWQAKWKKPFASAYMYMDCKFSPAAWRIGPCDAKFVVRTARTCLSCAVRTVLFPMGGLSVQADWYVIRCCRTSEGCGVAATFPSHSHAAIFCIVYTLDCSNTQTPTISILYSPTKQ